MCEAPSYSGHSCSLKFLRAYLYWGKQGMIAFRNIMLMQVWFGCKWRCRIFGESIITESYTPYNGGLKVALGCEWRRRISGECNCKFLDAI